MTTLITKVLRSLRQVGVLATARKGLRRLVSGGGLPRIEGGPYVGLPVEERFTRIYLENRWDSEESVSGPGSTLAYTENLRAELPPLFQSLGIRKIFDAPCGDFNWMQHVVRETGVHYIGGDIVSALITRNQSRHGGDGRDFITIDLTQGAFPAADLMVCRDCLFHLSFADTSRLLQNYLDSGIPYLLTTTHRNQGNFVNTDVETGGFRLIDLHAAPYHLPLEVLAAIDDWIAPHPPRTMSLWRREQVASALPRLRSAVGLSS
jgi:hypothetical protein